MAIPTWKSTTLLRTEPLHSAVEQVEALDALAASAASGFVPARQLLSAVLFEHRGKNHFPLNRNKGFASNVPTVLDNFPAGRTVGPD
jgi:hypothetical protein